VVVTVVMAEVVPIAMMVPVMAPVSVMMMTAMVMTPVTMMVSGVVPISRHRWGRLIRLMGSSTCIGCLG
jgi:hypothetical protein